jgi:hypothetical protein
VKGGRLGGLLARGLVGGAAAIIVVVATLLTWPLSVDEPRPDQRRVADLQRLAHAIDAFRARERILPASLARLPADAAAPIHTHDPITHRLYDYRPLGPLAYELCARFDAARPDDQRDFWWHDGGRYCFSLETSGEARRSATPAPGKSAAPPPEPDRGVPKATRGGEPGPDPGAASPASSAPPPDSPVTAGAAAPPGPPR